VEHWWPFDLLEEMGVLLGVGRFSNVYSSRLKSTGEEVAVKIIKVTIWSLGFRVWSLGFRRWRSRSSR
jgi:RIO-like serine/threonine protein kinase